MAQRVQAGLSKSRGRRFGLSVGGAFLLLAGIVWWRANNGAAFRVDVEWGVRRLLAATFGTVGLLLAFAGLVIPATLGPVERGWMSMAHAMSKVTTPIVMGVVYFVVLTPTALLMRAFGKNPLRGVKSGESAWIIRTAGKSDLRRQF